MGKAHWADDWRVGVHVWVEREGRSVLGEGRAELLAAIESEQSITKAAKAAGMSYRRAWNLIQEVNEAAGEPLVEAITGGARGGGARLTPHGRLALHVYGRLRSTLVGPAAGALRQAIHGDYHSGGHLHLAAAISMQEAVGQILAEFTLQEPLVPVRTIFGASNELADHLLAGAPGDVFISAEPTVLDRLAIEGLLIDDSRQVVAKNGLAIVGGKRISITKPADLLDGRIKRVVLAEPACPLGRYSKSYLEQLGLYEKLCAKSLFVDNSRAVLMAVATGVAQAGVAFSSDATTERSWRLLLNVSTSKVAATYESAMMKHSKNQVESRKLSDFLHSPNAARSLRRCGLRPASPAKTN